MASAPLGPSIEADHASIDVLICSWQISRPLGHLSAKSISFAPLFSELLRRSRRGARYCGHPWPPPRWGHRLTTPV
jgi:hypothetical protein